MVEESTRLLDLLAGRRVARPPLWEPWFLMDQALRTRYAGDPLALAEDLGHAAVRLHGLDLKVSFNKPVERIEATGVWYGGGALRDPEQLHRQPESDYAAAVSALLPLRQRCRDRGRACWLVLPWCFHSVATSMGLESFAIDCYDRPEFVREAMAFVEARNAAAIERVVTKVQPDFVLFDGDCAYKTGPMIDPAMMRSLVFEPSAPNVRRLHQLGIPPVFHTDGQLDAIVPLLLDLGFVAVHGCESAANDLGHLVEAFGDQIALCGNMDVVFLTHATIPEIQAATCAMLTTGSRKARFIAGCNTSPLDYIPWPNYRAFTDTVRTWTATC